MNRPKHISELLPPLCEELGIPCPEEVLQKAKEQKAKLDDAWTPLDDLTSTESSD